PTITDSPTRWHSQPTTPATARITARSWMKSIPCITPERGRSQPPGPSSPADSPGPLSAGVSRSGSGDGLLAIIRPAGDSPRAVPPLVSRNSQTAHHRPKQSVDTQRPRRFVSVGGNAAPPSVIMANLLGYFSNDIGIDLGTANTLVYVKDKG